MSKQYLYNTPDYVNKFYKQRRKDIDSRIKTLEKQMQGMKCVIAIGGTLEYQVRSVKVINGQGAFQVDIPMSCAFPVNGVVIYDNRQNIIYGTPYVHILMQVEFNFGMLDIENAEVVIPRNKISSDLMKVIKQVIGG